MKITQVVVGKGMTKEKKGFWEKTYFEISCLLEFEGEEDATKDKALTIIESWLDSKKESKHPAIKASSLERIPFKTYRNRAPCKPGEEGWAFKDTPEAKELTSHLDPEGRKWTAIGNIEYKLSGENLILINRRKVKNDFLGSQC